MNKIQLQNLQKLLNPNYTKPIKGEKLLEELNKVIPNEIEGIKDILKLDFRGYLTLDENHILYEEKISILQNILEENEINKTNRAELSSFGNSHNVKTNLSLLNILPNNNLNDLTTILVKEENKNVSIVSNVELKDTCLIIENLYCLDKINNTYMSDFFNKISDFDLIYGAGKQISNSLNIHILKEYKSIYTFFDLDKEGFDFFINLKKSLKPFGVEVINYVHPNTFELVENISQFKKYEKENNFNNITIFQYIENNKEHLSEQEVEVLLLLELKGIGVEQEIFFN